MDVTGTRTFTGKNPEVIVGSQEEGLARPSAYSGSQVAPESHQKQ